MTRLLREAISKVEKLPEAEQDRAAELLLGLAESGTQYSLSDKQAAEVELARKEAREGKFASDEDMAGLWRRFGL